MTNPIVAEHSHRQLHSFLDELKNGTQNYRTVNSLSQQVAQEYRGRCVIELMQNAHDALSEAPNDDPRCITFVLQLCRSVHANYAQLAEALQTALGRLDLIRTL
jgi:hypothetical protein